MTDREKHLGWTEEDDDSIARACAVLRSVDLNPGEVTGYEIWLASTIYDPKVHGPI